jgi:hypothetical protein
MVSTSSVFPTLQTQECDKLVLESVRHMQNDYFVFAVHVFVLDSICLCFTHGLSSSYEVGYQRYSSFIYLLGRVNRSRVRAYA